LLLPAQYRGIRLSGTGCASQSKILDFEEMTGYSCSMIRKAKIADVKSIQSVVNHYADQGQMLPRSLNELYENMRDFSLYEQESAILGVCALHISWDGLAEIRSLAVRREGAGKGIGTALVNHCLAEARELGAERVFVLTYQDAFFRKMGFSSIDKKDLPHKIWTDCLNCVKFPNCDETAMIRSTSILS
jgi:amino-acid N-acetyltransferase